MTQNPLVDGGDDLLRVLGTLIWVFSNHDLLFLVKSSMCFFKYSFHEFCFLFIGVLFGTFFHYRQPVGFEIEAEYWFVVLIRVPVVNLLGLIFEVSLTLFYDLACIWVLFTPSRFGGDFCLVWWEVDWFGVHYFVFRSIKLIISVK